MIADNNEASNRQKLIAQERPLRVKWKYWSKVWIWPQAVYRS